MPVAVSVMYSESNYNDLVLNKRYEKAENKHEAREGDMTIHF